MAGKYNVNWEKHETKGNVIRSGRKLKITTRPVTPMFSAVIIKNYKKVGRNWRGTPILVTQEKFTQQMEY